MEVRSPFDSLAIIYPLFAFFQGIALIHPSAFSCYHVPFLTLKPYSKGLCQWLLVLPKIWHGSWIFHLCLLSILFGNETQADVYLKITLLKMFREIDMLANLICSSHGKYMYQIVLLDSMNMCKHGHLLDCVCQQSIIALCVLEHAA